MAKCAGCSAATCSCSIEAGDGVTITGSGTSGSPWVISATGGGGDVHDGAGPGSTVTLLSANSPNATGDRAIAIGHSANAVDDYSIAMGYFASVSGGDRGIALGYNSVASNTDTVALGNAAEANGNAGIAIGPNATGGIGAIAIGAAAQATASSTIALGDTAEAQADNDIAMGEAAVASGNASIAIGLRAVSPGNCGVALGLDTSAIDTDCIAIGNSAFAESSGSAALGLGALARSHRSTALGASSKADGSESVALGSDAEAYGRNGIAIGYQTRVGDVANTDHGTIGALAIAIGQAAAAFFASSVAIGAGAVTTAANQIMLGTSAETVYVPGRVVDFVTADTQTASYTLILGDINKVIEMNNASANTLTVPPNSSVAFPVGTVIEVFQLGAGQCTITPGAGVTIRSDGAKLKTAAQYATAGLRKRATDEWVCSGDLSA